MIYTIDELRTIVTPVAVKYGLKSVYVKRHFEFGYNNPVYVSRAANQFAA